MNQPLDGSDNDQRVSRALPSPKKFFRKIVKLKLTLREGTRKGNGTESRIGSDLRTNFVSELALCLPRADWDIRD